jgi:flavorubredoxin
MSTHTQTPTLPRELAPGLFWLGRCLEQPFLEGQVLHAYNSVFLIKGTERSLLLEAGFPADGPVLERQIAELLADGDAPLAYIVPTHPEVPHASGAGRLLERYPDAVLCGSVTDYHLIFPEIADRLLPCAPGDELDLGGRTFVFVEAIIKDLVNSIWGFDTGARVLFPGDGFAYMHHHDAGQCAHLAEEVPEMPFEQLAAIFAEYALYWTRFTDVEPMIARLEELLVERDVQIIAPTHGLPITDLARTVPLVRAGLRVRG